MGRNRIKKLSRNQFRGESIEYVAPAEKIDKLKSILAELDGEHA